jgi:DnaJ-class molecular chaperone
MRIPSTYQVCRVCHGHGIVLIGVLCPRCEGAGHIATVSSRAKDRGTPAAARPLTTRLVQAGRRTHLGQKAVR